MMNADDYYDPTYLEDDGWDQYADEIYPDEPTQLGFEAWACGKAEDAYDRAMEIAEEIRNGGRGYY